MDTLQLESPQLQSLALQRYVQHLFYFESVFMRETSTTSCLVLVNLAVLLDFVPTFISSLSSVSLITTSSSASTLTSTPPSNSVPSPQSATTNPSPQADLLDFAHLQRPYVSCKGRHSNSRYHLYHTRVLLFGDMDHGARPQGETCKGRRF